MISRSVRQHAGNHRDQGLFKTTEFFAYLTAVLAVVITASVVSGDGNTAEPFNAEQALRYITFLTIGYMISRGLAKVGSRAPYAENR
jgi:hypothetical protein